LPESTLGKMKLKPVGQVSLGAKSIKIIVNLAEIDQKTAMGGIATFYVNLEHLKQVMLGKEQVTTFSQLVLK
jgi:hypothetical protein